MAEDDFLEFDVVSQFHGISGTQSDSLGIQVSLKELEEGTIIDTKPKDGEEGPPSEDDIWWTRDELVDHLKEAPLTLDDVPWDEKVNSMEPLVPDQVYKKILKPGIGPVICNKNAILFHCNGYIEGSDEPFDSSILRGRPFLHRLDREDLLPGLMIGILTMKLHEKAEILIRPDYAFGVIGCAPRIPMAATIVYIIEIIRIFEEGSLADYELMTPEEIARIPFTDILTKCNEQRMSGNSYFSNQRYRDACLRYNKAIRFLEKYFFKNIEEQEQAKELLSKLYPNAANALIHMKKVRPAMTLCRKALEINPKNLKALCQLGKAKFNNGEYDQAKVFFKRALDLRPQDSYIGAYLRRINDKEREYAEASLKLWTRIGQSYIN